VAVDEQTFLFADLAGFTALTFGRVSVERRKP